jgi:hypothetical protein
MTFGKNYTDNEEGNESHQLKKLKSGNIINQFYSFQKKQLKSLFDNHLRSKKLCQVIHFLTDH